jgi:hypothetical protein
LLNAAWLLMQRLAVARLGHRSNRVSHARSIQAVGPALLVPILFTFQQQRLGTHEGEG